MEILVKITDIKEGVNASVAIDEATNILQTDAKKIDTLLCVKARKKIDLVGDSCNLEISVKD